MTQPTQPPTIAPPSIAPPAPGILPGWSASVSYVNLVLNTAERLAADRELLLQATGLDAEQLSQPDARVPMEKLIALYRHAADILDNPDFGLEVGLSSIPQSHGILGYIVISTRSIREAFDSWIPIRYTLMHSGNTEVIDEGSQVRLRWHPLAIPFVEQRYLIDSIFSGWLALSLLAFDRPVSPLSAHFSYPEPTDTHRLRDTFGEQLRFDQPFNELTFSQQDFDTPNLNPSPDLLQLLRDKAQRMQKTLAASGKTSQKTQSQLLEYLPQGKGTISQVALRLNITERTLQRRLKDEGTSFNALLQSLRCDIAKQQLRRSEESIIEIALSLGYSDSSSFATAFKSWTGDSPSLYREQHTANG